MASGYFGMPTYFILKWKGDKILTADFEVFLPMKYYYNVPVCTPSLQFLLLKLLNYRNIFSG